MIRPPKHIAPFLKHITLHTGKQASVEPAPNGHWRLLLAGKVFLDKNCDPMFFPSSPSDHRWMRNKLTDLVKAGLLPSKSEKKETDWGASLTEALRNFARAHEEMKKVLNELESDPQKGRSVREQRVELRKAGKGDALLAALKRLRRGDGADQDIVPS